MQITIILMGTYRTPVRANSTIIPVHPAYTDLTLATARVRKIWNSGYEPGDPAKACLALWDLSLLSDPPFNLTLGKDAVALIRGKMTGLAHEIDTYESWSADLALE